MMATEEKNAELHQQLILNSSTAPQLQAMRDHETPPLNDVEDKLCCPNTLACIASGLWPCIWLSSCHTVREKEEVVILSCGKYVGTVRQPGCYCWNTCGTATYSVSSSRVAVNLDNVKVADARGNPLVISGVVTYHVAKARAAVLDVENVRKYIENQGLAVMKKMAAMYPYESQDGHSLKSEADRIREQMIHMLQDRCNVAGVVIHSFELTDLAYAPEIAGAMLIRQQAEAMVDARKIIVKGAVEIAHGALDGLANKGVKMEPDEQARMVTNLLVTICGDTKVQPTISLSSEAGGSKHH